MASKLVINSAIQVRTDDKLRIPPILSSRPYSLKSRFRCSGIRMWRKIDAVLDASNTAMASYLWTGGSFRERCSREPSKSREYKLLEMGVAVAGELAWS